jgi:hypothetical protein
MSQATITEIFPQIFQNESTVQQSLGEDFSLCDNGNMVFHWADYHETCDAVKKRMENIPEIKIEFKRKEMALNRLSLITVWIRTEKKVHQTTMFDLYERYILNQMQLSLGIDPFGPIEISFISGTGPFRSMAIAECFNNSTYKDFVMVYLLRGKLPKRDYRIRLKSKVLMEYGNDFSQAGLIGLEQLTMNGILFSLDSDVFLKSISPNSEMRILIDSGLLADACGKDLAALKNHLSQYAFNLMYSSRKEDAVTFQVQDLDVQSSFDFLKNKKAYLFVSYEKLSAKNGKIEGIRDFVKHTRNMISEHYKEALVAKSA